MSTSPKPCPNRKILSDKWMIAVFPLITLALFMVGIVLLYGVGQLAEFLLRTAG